MRFKKRVILIIILLVILLGGFGLYYNFKDYIDPAYSNDVLISKMADEKDQIEKTITSLFSSDNYSITNEKLYHRGEWFAGALTVYQINSFGGSSFGNPDNYDNYYVVFKKNTRDNSWNLVGGPSLILTKPSNPSIPTYVLDDINPSN